MIIPIIICNQGASDVVGHRWPRRVWRSHQVLLSWSTGTIKKIMMIMLYMLINHIDALTKSYYRGAQVGETLSWPYLLFCRSIFFIFVMTMVIVLLVKFYYCGVQITMELVLTIMPIFVFISYFCICLSFCLSRLVSLLSPQQTTVLYWQFANGGKRLGDPLQPGPQKLHKRWHLCPSGSFKLWTRKWWGGEGRVA